MSLLRTGAEVLDSQVTLELESWDRVDLNVDQPKLRTPRALCHLLRDHSGEGAVSSHQMKAITEPFLESIDQYAREHHVPLLSFERGQRKEDLAAKYLTEFSGTEGVLFIAKAQEKIRTCRTEGRRNERGPTYPWIMASTAVVHQYSFDAVDGDFGLFFLKYSSYFPDGAKFCFNGPESLKRQLTQEGLGYEELANGILSGANPRRMRKLADGLTPWRIERFLRKWQNYLPRPFTRNQQTAGSRYEISMCQVEFALTQIVDRPVQGRIFFEEVVRENLDLGRPDNLQLIFGHRVTKRTTGPFRTRVVRAGVIRSLLVASKSNRLKQYFKEGRGLGTELTVHNPGDDGLGRRLENRPAVPDLGFPTNRRVLPVPTLGHDFVLSQEWFREVTGRRRVGDQRASAWRFGDPQVQALLGVLVLFRLWPWGFRRRDGRQHRAPLLGDDPAHGPRAGSRTNRAASAGTVGSSVSQVARGTR